MKLNFSFSRRGPDRVSEELATVLSKKGSWEFKALFDVFHASLRAKDLARGGEEMLRLRAHEKLQSFLKSGIVTKTGKEYTGVPKAIEAFFKSSAEFNARFASGTHVHPRPNLAVAEAAPVPAVKMAVVAKAKVPGRKARAGTGKAVRKATARAR